jgi:preprotein translocase subunit SecG
LKYFYTFGLSLGEASLISEVYFLQAASTKHFLDRVTYYFLRLFKVFIIIIYDFPLSETDWLSQNLINED